MLHSNRMTKAQGLPISTIIIAIIGLIVLVILIVVVQQQISKTGKGLREVEETKCEPENQIEPVGADCEVIYAKFQDVRPGQICCRKGTVR